MAKIDMIFGGTARKIENHPSRVTKWIHYSKLKDNPAQYRYGRTSEERQALREEARKKEEALADLIEADGEVLQDLLVRKIDTDEYEIIAGHHRRGACRILVEERGKEQYSMLPCLVRNISDVRSEFAVYSSNGYAQKTDYEIMCEIEGMKHLLETYPEEFPEVPTGRMVERLGKLLGMKKSTIGEYLNISNNLGEKGIKKFQSGELKKSAAVALAGIPETEQNKLLDQGIITHKQIKEKKKQLINSISPITRGCITGKNPNGNCVCCGKNDIECCGKCTDDCNGRCGWIESPVVAISQQQEDGAEYIPGKCMYNPKFPCSLSEKAMRTPGTGEGNCGEACCWECLKEECKLRCKVSEDRMSIAAQQKRKPELDRQEILMFLAEEVISQFDIQKLYEEHRGHSLQFEERVKNMLGSELVDFRYRAIELYADFINDESIRISDRDELLFSCTWDGFYQLILEYDATAETEIIDQEFDKAEEEIEAESEISDLEFARKELEVAQAILWEMTGRGAAVDEKCIRSQKMLVAAYKSLIRSLERGIQLSQIE